MCGIKLLIYSQTSTAQPLEQMEINIVIILQLSLTAIVKLIMPWWCLYHVENGRDTPHVILF